MRVFCGTLSDVTVFSRVGVRAKFWGCGLFEICLIAVGVSDDAGCVSSTGFVWRGRIKRISGTWRFCCKAPCGMKKAYRADSFVAADDLSVKKLDNNRQIIYMYFITESPNRWLVWEYFRWKKFFLP